MKRSKHSLSHYVNFTCDMGKIIPIACYEVLPGDTIQQSSSCLIRTTPLLAPVMHPVHVDIHHWYVPNRVIWPGDTRDANNGDWNSWETFITGGHMDSGQIGGGVIHPYVEVTTGNEAGAGSLWDYLGVPAGTGALDIGLKINSLPARAYNKVFNEFYRDQDLVDIAPENEGDASENWADYALLDAPWEKDYFTTCRPWPQKGPDVILPIGTSAPIINDGHPLKVKVTGATGRNIDVAMTTNALSMSGAGIGSTDQLEYDNEGLLADLSNATGASINEFRFALATQKDQEARSIYGSRFTEYLRYLGVRSSDSRLQRPEYLGGGRQTLQFSEVLQTGVTTSGNAAGVGTLRGHGIGALRSNRYRKFFEEHGIILSLMIVRPVTMYPQGLFRMWNRRTKYDYWNKEFQHVGQQEVYLKELYAKDATAADDAVFGYQDRYDEYRHAESRVAGEFRTSTANFWSMFREFGSTPQLNDEFVTSNPTNRIYAATNVNQLQVMCYHSIQARRLVHSDGNPRGLG